MNTSPTLASEYSSPDPLQVRIDTHARYSEHPDDPIAAVISTLTLTGEEDLADIGCGDARFLARLAEHGHRGRLVGIDASPVMVATANKLPGVEARLGDAQQLPFADNTFDRATARHMLYHVPDPAKALRELRRITFPGGLVAVTVNHPETCPRTRELVVAHARSHGLSPTQELANSVSSLTLPPLMADVFPDVQIHPFDNALAFDHPAPLVRFAEALFSFCGIATDSPQRAEILETVTADIDAWFTAHPGQLWRDPKGYIVATAVVQ